MWNPKKAEEPRLNDTEKATIRSSLLDAIIRCADERKIRVQYEDLIYKVQSG